MPNGIYSFENKGRRKFPCRDDEKTALKEFAERLKCEPVDFTEHHDTVLDFILNHHKVISRYQELRNRERRLRVLFTVISIVLLFAIPLMIYGMGALSGDSNKGIITAQMTAVLTGMLAVHKSLSSWMDKRKVIGNFWKAESDLKSKLYAFEDKWKGKAAESLSENQTTIKRLKNEFVSAIQAAVAEARAVVQDEQSKFFEAITYPSIDLAEMLKSSGDQAKSLVGAFTSPELEERDKQRRDKAALEARIQEQKKKIKSLETEMEKRKVLIEAKRTVLATAPAEDVDSIKSEITGHKAKVRQSEEELVIARAQLDVLMSDQPA